VSRHPRRALWAQTFLALGAEAPPGLSSCRSLLTPFQAAPEHGEWCVELFVVQQKLKNLTALAVTHAATITSHSCLKHPQQQLRAGPVRRCTPLQLFQQSLWREAREVTDPHHQAMPRAAALAAADPAGPPAASVPATRTPERSPQPSRAAQETATVQPGVLEGHDGGRLKRGRSRPAVAAPGGGRRQKAGV